MKEIIKHKFPYLLFFLLLFSSFASVYGQERTVTLNLSKVPLNTALKEIEKQTSMSVVYNTNDVDINRVISIKVTKEPLNNVMNQLFRGVNTSFSIVDNHIVLSAKNSEANQQKKTPITANGTVTDTKGEPLIGVSVLVKGTSNGTITDMDGNFKIQAAKGDVLEISYIGYASQAITLADNQPLKVTLGEATEVLDEVVVTALGIKRATKALSYNVQEVKSDEITTVKDANFMNSLAGKVAGVNINTSSSGVGGATRVVMRGVKSITQSNNALYVIDGVPIYNTNNGSTEGIYSSQPRGEGISDLNPDDIESMSVLSGPAAAALYGSNAASGVILITTKKGKAGKPQITISNNTTFSKPFTMPEFQNSYINRSGEFKSWGIKTASPYGNYEPDDFFQTGTNIQNSVSLSVGNEKQQTYISVATTNADGIIKNNEYNRYNFTVRNTTSFLNDKMTLDAGFSYIIQNDKNLMAQGEYFNPLPAVYLFPRGEDFEAVRMYETWDSNRNIYVQNWKWDTQGVSMQNPYWLSQKNNYGTKKQRYMANASLKYKVLDWLDVTGRVRIDNSIGKFEDERYASTNTIWTATSEKGFYKWYKEDDRQVYADLIANINKNIGDFSIAANVGVSISQLYYDQNGYQGGLADMSNVFIPNNIVNTTSSDTHPIYSSYKQRTNAIFASAEIGWKSMLYMTLTGRNDWDSALANTNTTSFFYPSVGLSALVSEMVALPEWINYLKVRGSFASVGSPIPRGVSSAANIKFDDATQSWVTNDYRPVGELKPERTDSWEAGLTAKFWGNRFSLDLTWYKSNTKNQTMLIPISASGGYTQMYVQSGNVQNTGMELAVGFNNTWGDFNWNSTVTYSFNKNKIVSLHEYYRDGKAIDKGGYGNSKIMLTEGGTMGDLYVTTALKRDQQGDVLIENDNVVKETLTNPKKIGSVLPKGNLGFRNSFSYKGINASFMLAARFGGVALSATQAVMDQFGVSKTSADYRDMGGVPVNNGTVSTESYYSVVGGINGVLENYVYSATNVRLQEVSLGYTLPGKWFNDKMRMSLSLVGRNLWMIYCKAPFDPEATASTGTFYQGFDYFMQPSLRNFGFSVKFQF